MSLILGAKMRERANRPMKWASWVCVLVTAVAAISAAGWTLCLPIHDPPPSELAPAILPAEVEEGDREDAVAVTVMTYNIHHGEGADGRIDLERIAAVIRRGAADVVALQEVDRKTRRSGGVDQLEKLSELTGMKGSFGKAKNHSGGEFGNAILSRYPIETVLNVSLPTGLGREPRSVLIARIAVPRPEGKPVAFLMLSTHFDFLPGSRVRIASVAKIRDVMKEYQGIPCVLAGDMNARPGSDTITELRRDWSRVRGAEALPTYPAKRPSREIDHLLCRPAARWSALEVVVLGDAEASDHRALVAKLRLADR